jgi:hypothetical protein
MTVVASRLMIVNGPSRDKLLDAANAASGSDESIVTFTGTYWAVSIEFLFSARVAGCSPQDESGHRFDVTGEVSLVPLKGTQVTFPYDTDQRGGGIWIP